MSVCAGIKRNGDKCTVSVEPWRTYCHHHDPARTSERKRAASRAGRSRPSQELTQIKDLLKTLTDQVLEGSLDRGIATVANLLINTQLRSIDMTRKLVEQQELEERLEALEARAKESR